VCLCVCVHACMCSHVYLRNHTLASPNFLCMLPVAMAQSSSGGTATHYVLPDLWMINNGSYGGLILVQCCVQTNTMLHGFDCILYWTMTNTKTRRVLCARGAGSSMQCTITPLILQNHCCNTKNNHQLHAQLSTTHHILVPANYAASLHASPGQCALCSNSHSYKYKSVPKPSLTDNTDKLTSF